MHDECEENPECRSEESGPEQEDESAIRQRIILAVRQKAGLGASDAEAKAKTEDGPSAEAKLRGPTIFSNGMDYDGDLDEYDADTAGNGYSNGAESSTVAHDAAMTGGLSEAIAAEISTAASHDDEPDPLAQATRSGATLEPLNRVRNSFADYVPPLSQALRSDPRLVRPKAPDIQNGEAERLLEGLIAECHFLMREVVLPSAIQSVDAEERRRFLGSAMEIAQMGATVAKTVAKLRRGSSPAKASRISKEEHIQTSQ
jgi:hypothetical protein